MESAETPEVIKTALIYRNCDNPEDGQSAEKDQKKGVKTAQNSYLANSCIVIFHNGFSKNRLRDDFRGSKGV